MSDRDTDPGGGFGVLDGGALLNESRGTTIDVIRGVHLSTDTSTDRDAGEAFEDRLLWVVSSFGCSCWRKMPGQTKVISYEFTKAMNRCVIVRDEQINAKRSEIEKKDKVKAEMKVKIVESDTKIDELLKKMKTL